MKYSDVIFTDHFNKQRESKGFTEAQITEAIENPYKITDVSRYPGQKRYCGGGVAVVMNGNRAITIYLDGVVTELREDQKNDKAALNSKRLRGIR